MKASKNEGIFERFYLDFKKLFLVFKISRTTFLHSPLKMVAPEFKLFLQLSYKNLAKIYHNVQEYVPPANAGR